jgi:hypothetical protein
MSSSENESDEEVNKSGGEGEEENLGLLENKESKKVSISCCNIKCTE